MTEEAKNRLQRARINAGFKSHKEAARFHGWSENTLASHEQGKRGLTTKAAQKYGIAFKVSPSWLLTGENQPDWYNQPAKKNTISIIKTRQVPIISYNTLLDIHLNKNSLSNIMPDSSTINIPVLENLPEELAALKIEFETNSNTIRNGDFIAIEMYSDWDYGDFVIACLDGEEVLPMQVYEDTNVDNKRVPFLKYLTEGRMPIELNSPGTEIIARIFFRGEWL